MERPKYIEVLKDFADFKKGDIFEYKGKHYTELIKETSFSFGKFFHVDFYDKLPDLFNEVFIDLDNSFELSTGINANLFRTVVNFMSEDKSINFHMTKMDIENIIRRHSLKQ